MDRKIETKSRKRLLIGGAVAAAIAMLAICLAHNRHLDVIHAGRAAHPDGGSIQRNVRGLHSAARER